MKEQSKAWSITSLVCGILGNVLFLAPYFGLPLSIIGIVAYGVDKNKNGMSKAGLVLSIIGTVTNVITGLFVFVIFIVASNL